MPEARNAEREVIGLFEVNIPSGESEEDLQLFQYAFSHDLRASLRPLIGFGHYLKTGEVCEAREGKFQNKMVQAGDQLERQLDGLAEYARLCLRPVRPESLDLSVFLRAAIEQQLAGFGLGEECVELGEGIPSVVADRGILKLILGELISNALLFTQAEQSPRVEIRGQRQGDWVELLIQDRGLGIPAERLPLLGKPFQRFHGQPHLSPGAGLGLTRTLRGLAALRGRLGCASEADQGTTVRLSLGAA